MLYVTVEIFPTGLPVWAAIVAVLLALLLSMIQAIMNQLLALQVMHELISEYLFPGCPVGKLIFKATTYIGVTRRACSHARR